MSFPNRVQGTGEWTLRTPGATKTQVLKSLESFHYVSRRNVSGGDTTDPVKGWQLV